MVFPRLLKIKPLGFLAAAILLTLSALTPPLARAEASEKEITYSLEPLVGYEFQKKENPSRRTRVFTYGGRIIAGYKILSAEVEYTVGKSDESFTDINTRIEEKSQTLRAGLRSTYSIGSLLDWYLRGGAETQKRHTIMVRNNVLSEMDTPSKVYPYAGTGVSVKVGGQLSLNASIIATLKDIKNLSQNEYTTTLGVNVNFNTR